MKKALIAAAMLMGGTAMAQVEATDVGPAVKKEAKDIGKNAKENARELGSQAGVATTDDKTYKAEDAFELKGTVQRATRNRLTVERENLPQASLDIRRETEVTIDGQKAQAKDLKEGMDIKAQFQLEGRETVAVKVDATSNDKAMGGSGAAGTELKKDAKEAKDELKKDAKDAKQDMEK